MTEILTQSYTYMNDPLKSTNCQANLNVLSPSKPTTYSPNASLLNSLLQFYDNIDNMKQLYLLISGEDKISLRLLEWTVINHARSEGLIINNGITDRFNIHVNYKATLSGYSKEQFDPCCRTERIGINYMDKILTTTVGQMNFIRWSIENKILDYIRTNFAALFKEMKQWSKTIKKAPIDPAIAEKKANGIKTRKKRSDNLNHTQKNFKIENCKTTLSFGF